MTTPAIATTLATALRNYPCLCKRADQWPIFGNHDKVYICARCAALEAFDKAKASHEIVQKEGVAGFVQQHPGGKSSL